jgi:hypothetical protein
LFQFCKMIFNSGLNFQKVKALLLKTAPYKEEESHLKYADNHNIQIRLVWKTSNFFGSVLKCNTMSWESLARFHSFTSFNSSTINLMTACDWLMIYFQEYKCLWQHWNVKLNSVLCYFSAIILSKASYLNSNTSMSSAWKSIPTQVILNFEIIKFKLN